MENFQISAIARARQGVLRSLNLRSEELERTLLMFLVYTLTSVGLIWLELSTVGLFLDEFGAEKLPWIYIASAFIGSSLGFVYSWMQKILPLRRTVVVVMAMMSVPLFLFRFGIGYENTKIAGISIAFITIFLMWLWVEACYVLNDLNTSITSNQLFNIREIKRTYPLVSSGYLVAGVVSGFSLPLLLYVVKLKNVTLISGLMVATGSVLLYYLTEKYSQAFPETARWTDDDDEDDQQEFAARKVTGPLQKYAIPLVSFFVLAEVLYVLVDFQFYSQLEYKNPGDGASGASWIASFLGIYEGIQGLFQVATQWFASSRLVERIGVFVTAMILPAGIAILGVLTLGASLGQLVSVFIGLILLRFLDELLHYTLLETVSPVLFQPIPDNIRSGIQTLVNGVGEPLSCGATGVVILGMLWVTDKILPHETESAFHDLQSLVFIGTIVVLALVWVFVVWLIRSQYVGLLVKSAERGRLGVTDVDLKALKRAVVETLEQPGGEDEKRSCIELLTQIDPKNVGEVLAPILDSLSPLLQRQSLETMLQHPNPAYLEFVRALSQQPLPPEVLALALRYIWLTEAEPNIDSLRPYLQQNVDPVVRGTAAALIMRRGDRQQKAEATNTLRQMLTHKLERERVMGTRALGEADYLQGLRLYIPNLLQDESLRVRCALLDVISSTHSEEYYPSLLRGLGYKSTREAALQAIVKLHNDAIPLLVYLAEDIHKPDLVRLQAWTALGQIGTVEAIDILVSNLMTAWGTTRRNILRILLKMPSEAGIEGVLDRIGRSGLETLIEQELMFIGQIYAGLVDLSGVTTYDNFSDRDPNSAEVPANDTAQLLQRALAGLEADAKDRCFLLMKFLYPLDTVQAAAFNIASGQPSLVARGLEILDNTVDIVRKRSLINLLDQHSEREKLTNLSELMVYKPLTPSDRLRRLLELRHFLSDWALACCFHLAKEARWSLTAQQTLVCLQHPTGFVREAVLAYLKIASPRALLELLPRLQNDPDRLVFAQVEEMMAELGVGGKR
ncbi:HEAT repeat domain-containing protein [Tychonema sp. LEGE 07199]|uniref:HEAT repeat domain-containing protein n=1 Tax=unclassified Tychonema TaxID=2642144 RepID=UPI001881B96B|nr:MULTISPECIES: HEAT repeat domain-containing protein [unclassified Tychonema]MBE9119778.1 HEAT repeat domain-containing protein [Tychonema sp. LEGE 07199]MBE9132151.1 HEAT repeat domain-containing protein [Tychonema sp. LEGE 07196]